METNLLLTSCRSPYLDSDKVYPPLGMLYLKSAVDKELGINVDLCDDYDLSKPETFEGYSHVGISTMTPQREESLKLLKTIKTYYPDTKVIIGGPHALHYQEEVVKEGYDYVVTRDGQKNLIDVLKKGDQRVYTDVMTKQEWADQPRPDRTSDKAKEFLSTYTYQLNGRDAGTMLTATGCPMKCTFCEDAMTAVRWSPLEKITQELDDLVDLGKSAVYLFDDLFAIAMPKVKPIAEELKKRDLIYRCNGQANFFTKWGEDFAKLLGDTGCYEIAFGHETGSQEILDNIRKQTEIRQNWESIEFAKKQGIKVKSFLMLGLPGETMETISQTENFIANAGMDDFQLAIYYPYKGTQIRDAIDRGENKDDIRFEGEGLGAYGQSGGKTESVVRTGELTSEQLLAERDRLVAKYKPESHSHFFDTHLTTESEYEPKCGGGDDLVQLE